MTIEDTIREAFRNHKMNNPATLFNRIRESLSHLESYEGSNVITASIKGPFNPDVPAFEFELNPKHPSVTVTWLKNAICRRLSPSHFSWVIIDAKYPAPEFFQFPFTFETLTFHLRKHLLHSTHTHEWQCAIHKLNAQVYAFFIALSSSDICEIFQNVSPDEFEPYLNARYRMQLMEEIGF
jgi:hypothetical protein